MTQDSKQPHASGKARRKTKWVPGGLQLKIGVSVFCVAAIILMVNLQFGILGLWRIYKQPLHSVEEALQQTKEMLIGQFAFFSIATVVLSVWAARSYFNLCGPIYHFKQYLLSLAKGRWDVKCSIRHGDKLQDMREAINGTVGLMTDRIKSQHQILKELRECLEAGSADSPSGARLEALMAKIDEEAIEYSHRFGESETTAAAEKLPDEATAVVPGSG